MTALPSIEIQDCFQTMVLSAYCIWCCESVALGSEECINCGSEEFGHEMESRPSSRFPMVTSTVGEGMVLESKALARAI